MGITTTNMKDDRREYLSGGWLLRAWRPTSTMRPLMWLVPLRVVARN